MNYDQVIAKYRIGLQNGGKSPDKFLPPDIEASQRDELRGGLSEVLSTLQLQLGSYQDAELDSLAMPHPFLSLLTIRELLYLMSYHPLHHLELVKKNL